MVQGPFHPADLPNAAGPAEAFDPQRWTVYGLQNHLALEIVDHLVEEGTSFSFRGGTALHSKLGTRARHSVDVDLDSVSPAEIHAALQAFAKRFPLSVQLEPPKPLKIPGEKHFVTFPLTADGRDPAKQVLVEVAKWDELGRTEPMPLFADGLTWPHRAQGPSLSAFMGQKLSTLGPGTVGIAIGPNLTHAQLNQSVAKQLFDLRELGRQALNPRELEEVYRREVEAVAARRAQRVTVGDAVNDAKRLVEELRAPRELGLRSQAGYALWSGYRDTRRFVLAGGWDETAFRVTGGVVGRVLDNLGHDVPWATLTQPLTADRVPADRLDGLEQAIRRREAWVPPHEFGGVLPVAWAWSPKELW